MSLDHVSADYEDKDSLSDDDNNDNVVDDAGDGPFVSYPDACRMYTYNHHYRKMATFDHIFLFYTCISLEMRMEFRIQSKRGINKCHKGPVRPDICQLCRSHSASLS